MVILNSADLRRRAHVRAAAQLARERAVADLDHPHDVAVLLAEQRHRAERARLVERRRERAHRLVLEDPAVDAVLDVAQLLGAERRAVGEVEAQLVRARRRSRPGARACRAARAARRAAGAWRCGWPRSRGARARSTRATHALALVQRALLELDARPPGRRRARTTSSTRARQSPSSHSIDAGVGDLAAARRVERRLGELDEHAPSSRATRGDRGRLLERLVAGELASARPPASARAARADRARAPRAGAARPRALLAPSAARSPPRRRRGPASAASSRVRSNGKPKVSCRRKTSCRRRCPPRRAWRARSAPRAASCPARACGRSSPPRRASHLWIASRCSRELRVRAAHQLASRVGVARQEAGLDARASGPAGSRGA